MSTAYISIDNTKVFDVVYNNLVVRIEHWQMLRDSGFLRNFYVDHPDITTLELDFFGEEEQVIIDLDYDIIFDPSRYNCLIIKSEYSNIKLVSSDSTAIHHLILNKITCGVDLSRFNGNGVYMMTLIDMDTDCLVDGKWFPTLNYLFLTGSWQGRLTIFDINPDTRVHADIGIRYKLIVSGRRV